jgi:hypothetical protein
VGDPAAKKESGKLLPTIQEWKSEGMAQPDLTKTGLTIVSG